MRLQGKRAVVTGAAAGIGRAIALAFAREGASVAVADLDAAGAERLAAKLRAGGSAALAIGTDVSQGESVAAMVDATVAAFGGLDVLVNNAGIVHPLDTDPERTPESAWDRTLAVNLKSVFLGAKYAVPAIEAGGGGSIVNIASVVGLMGSFPSQIAYTASKGGVIALSRELAVIYARRNIRVNAICPGVTATAIAEAIVVDDAGLQRRREHIPMGRMADPDEIGRVAAFLASDDASYVTGQAIPVDGGMVGAYLVPPD